MKKFIIFKLELNFKVMIILNIICILFGLIFLWQTFVSIYTFKGYKVYKVYDEKFRKLISEGRRKIFKKSLKLNILYLILFLIIIFIRFLIF